MRDYFCGWYLKMQSENQVAALIPAWHMSRGAKSCSIQLITMDGAWNLVFPYEAFRKGKDFVIIGPNRFTREGIQLDLQGPGILARGKLQFGSFQPIRYDIMGPFRYAPRMECRHSVYSMGHRVDGFLEVNGKRLDFTNGTCYIEGDRGYSFPKAYLWTQCCFPEGSVMLSVAEIPYCGLSFTGIIGVIRIRGREYRLATYLGARVTYLENEEVEICQGKHVLRVKLLEKKGFPLAAPVAGSMARTIHESAACTVFYQFLHRGEVLWEFASDLAAWEYEYPK